MSQRKSVRAKDEAMRARESLREIERQRQSHPELAREPEKMSVIASKNLRDVVRESRSERYSSYTGGDLLTSIPLLCCDILNLTSINF